MRPWLSGKKSAVAGMARRPDGRGVQVFGQLGDAAPDVGGPGVDLQAVDRAEQFVPLQPDGARVGADPDGCFYPLEVGEADAAQFGTAEAQVAQCVQDVGFLGVRRVDEPGLRRWGCGGGRLVMRPLVKFSCASVWIRRGCGFVSVRCGMGSVPGGAAAVGRRRWSARACRLGPETRCSGDPQWGGVSVPGFSVSGRGGKENLTRLLIVKR